MKSIFNLFNFVFLLSIYSIAFSNENNVTTEQVNSYMSKSSENAKCIISFTEEYKKKVFQDCQKSGEGDNIGGGCYHIVGYSINTNVLKDAFTHCTKEPS